jgi:site-specific DNA-methyltransferase (adenine-specific)
MITGYKEKSEYISKNGVTSTVYLMDCMEGMRGYADNHFDLAVVDPEFGIGIGNSPRLVTDKGLKAKAWDNKPIDMKYFDELFRVSKNQIVWGGNYYALPSTKHCIVWDKKQPEKLSFGMFDFAWTSFDGANKMFRKSVQDEQDKIHPTQKPIKLYDWIFANYAKPNDKILDTHLGSGSSRIAADRAGLNFIGFELDADYYQAQEKRFKNHVSQLTLF